MPSEIKPKRETLSDKAKKYMNDIENEQNPEQAWEKLCKIYDHLRDPKCDYKYKEQLLKRLVPFLAKYGDRSELKDHKYMMKD
jgi:hypothetical protein